MKASALTPFELVNVRIVVFKCFIILSGLKKIYHAIISEIKKEVFLRYAVVY